MDIIMRERALRLDGLVEYRRRGCDGVDFAAVLENDPDDIEADEVIPDFVAGLLRDPDDVYTPPHQPRAPHIPHTTLQQQPIPQPQIYFLNAVPVSPMPLPVASFQVSMMFRVA